MKRLIARIGSDPKEESSWLEVEMDVSDGIFRYTSRTIGKLKEKQMPRTGMSRDRVEFTMPSVNNKQAHALAHVIRDVFEIEDYTDALRYITDRKRFRCRPSQFARFVIARDAAGIHNDMKGLQMELLLDDQPRGLPILNLTNSGNDASNVKRFELICNEDKGSLQAVQSALRTATGNRGCGVILPVCCNVVMYKSKFPLFIEELWRLRRLNDVVIDESLEPKIDPSAPIDVSQQGFS